MNLPLFRVGARLNPKAGFGVELIPRRQHGLARTTAGEHDESKAIGCRRVAVFGQCVAEGGELGWREKALMPSS